MPNIKKIIIHIITILLILHLVSCTSQEKAVVDGITTELHEAARDSDIAKIEQLIKKGTNLNVRDELGLSALHFTCHNGDVQVAGLLINAGINVNLQDMDGNTPLHLCAINCYASLAAELLKNGADPKIVNNNGQNPLQIAQEIDCRDVITIFEKMGK